MAYKLTRHRFHAVGDDAPLPPCGPNIPVGGQCQQPANAPDAFVDQVTTLWSSITGTGTSAPDPSLPDCATAQVGQKCNSVSAAQAAQNASSSSTNRMLMLGGAALLGVYLLFGRKKGRR